VTFWAKLLDEETCRIPTGYFRGYLSNINVEVIPAFLAKHAVYQKKVLCPAAAGE
jgi:hypothetical protein